MSAEPTIVKSWYNASNANDGSCFDTQFLSDGVVQVRNSRNTGVVIDFTPEEWAAMIAGAKAGKFDPVV